MSVAVSVEPPIDSPSDAWHAEPMSGGGVARMGPVRAVGLSDSERHYAVAIHLSALATFFFPVAVFAPLILWLVRKDQSHFADDHGKEMVNFLISFVVLHVLLILAIVTIIGIPLTLIGIPAIWISGLINVPRAALAAGRGEYFRYPMTIRFLT